MQKNDMVKNGQKQKMAEAARGINLNVPFNLTRRGQILMERGWVI
jgi:hypothetical protein